jgi:GT2 family glycosyltransferase/glycosyltransferase involved in cell wall biosynthesis
MIMFFRFLLQKLKNVLAYVPGLRRAWKWLYHRLSRADRVPELSQALGLLLAESRIPTMPGDTPIDILIPVYNGFQYFDALFTSILQNTTIPYRLIIANDKSSDPLVSEYLADLVKNNPEVNIQLIQNEQNLGFVRTVNKLAGLAQNHFVILNTDTEVPPHWLERLMAPILNNPKIASTTPFTNAGAICSFPNFLEDNPIFQNLDVASLDSFFQYVNFDVNVLEIPTGVGFCMGVNKKTCDQIGMFNEVFGKGYGEENDWCVRARHAGYKNIMVPNLFVYHKHGGSFTSAEKKQLGETNLKLIEKMHPDYLARVAAFTHKDPLKNLRNILKVKILASLAPTRLIFDHSLGGGANEYSNSLIAGEKLATIATVQRTYLLRLRGSEFEEITYSMARIQEIEQVIQLLNIQEILINELVGFPRVFELADFFLALKRSFAALKFTYLVHDYYSVCPIYMLLNDRTQYCGVPSNLDECSRCLKKNILLKTIIPHVRNDYPSLEMPQWRSKFGELLSSASRIICFSQSSRMILQKAYPKLLADRIEVTPHLTNWVRPVQINKTNQSINIAILGNLSIIKGAAIIAALATHLNTHHPEMKLHIFGEIISPYPSFDLTNIVRQHGKYKKTALPELMEKNEIDLVFIASICPETFSYTTAEAVNMGLPVAVFDLGAPAERIRNYPKGIILENQQPEYIAQAISSYFNR